MGSRSAVFGVAQRRACGPLLLWLIFVCAFARFCDRSDRCESRLSLSCRSCGFPEKQRGWEEVARAQVTVAIVTKLKILN